MPKFKVGDVVKITSGDSYNGGSGTISFVYDDLNPSYLLDGSREDGEEFEHLAFSEEELVYAESESVTESVSVTESLLSSVPNYYLLPTGIQVIDVTRWLTGNAAQAVQYIARSSRVDEVYKGDRVKDLRKALDFINNEIERLELGDE